MSQKFDSLKTLQRKFSNLPKEALQRIKEVVNSYKNKTFPGYYRTPLWKCVTPALEEIDQLLEGHGVETVRGSSYPDVLCDYVNMGDTYVTTILFDYKTERFYATDLGTQLEEYDKKGVEYI